MLRFRNLRFPTSMESALIRLGSHQKCSNNACYPESIHALCLQWIRSLCVCVQHDQILWLVACVRACGCNCVLQLNIGQSRQPCRFIVHTLPRFYLKCLLHLASLHHNDGTPAGVRAHIPERPKSSDVALSGCSACDVLGLQTSFFSGYRFWDSYIVLQLFKRRLHLYCPRLHLCDYVAQTNIAAVDVNGRALWRRDLDVLELYSGSCQLSKRFRAHGYRAQLRSK